MLASMHPEPRAIQLLLANQTLDDMSIDANTRPCFLNSTSNDGNPSEIKDGQSLPGTSKALLHVACEGSPGKDNAASIAAIVGSGASVRALDSEGRAPLHRACMRPDAKVCLAPKAIFSQLEFDCACLLGERS